MEAGPAAVAELQRARDQRRNLDRPGREAADADERVLHQRGLGLALRAGRDVLDGAAAAAVDDRARRIDARRPRLHDPHHPGAQEPGVAEVARLAGKLRLDEVAGHASRDEHDASRDAGERVAAVDQGFDAEAELQRRATLPCSA